ncbi:hypothetical protein L6R49_28485 [Myxococcota bacterium]|nr:hypothetical protein [Myxococcota bacterium]
MRLTAPLVTLPFVLFTACGGGATPPEQLEAATATPALVQEEFTDLSAAGALQVSGEGQDLTLTVGEGEGALTVDVHSAGRTDLSALSGLSVTADLLVWGFESSRSLLLRDEAGGLLYALDAGWSLDAVNEALGAERLRWGDEVATDKDDTWTWSYTSLIVSTDDGELSLLPGDVANITLDGVPWRLAVVAAYAREVRPNAALPGCPVLDDVLSYELLRLETAGEDDVLIRPEGLDPASAGCL